MDVTPALETAFGWIAITGAAGSGSATARLEDQFPGDPECRIKEAISNGVGTG